MKSLIRLTAGAAGLLAVTLAGQAFAQAPNAIRIRGQVVSVDGAAMKVKSREGDTYAVTLGTDARVGAVVKAALSEVGKDSYVGIAALPGTGGHLRALEVLIFPEAMKGTVDTFRAWDLMPESTMTNATVTDTVKGVSGNTLQLAYKGGEKTIDVPEDAPVVRLVPGDKAEIVAGAAVIVNGVKADDGSVTATNVTVGRGIVPPM